jgi:predicted  nucleic acid-binding Zn-ribbon protein
MPSQTPKAGRRRNRSKKQQIKSAEKALAHHPSSVASNNESNNGARTKLTSSTPFTPYPPASTELFEDTITLSPCVMANNLWTQPPGTEKAELGTFTSDVSPKQRSFSDGSTTANDSTEESPVFAGFILKDSSLAHTGLAEKVNELSGVSNLHSKDIKQIQGDVESLKAHVGNAIAQESINTLIKDLKILANKFESSKTGFTEEFAKIDETLQSLKWQVSATPQQEDSTEHAERLANIEAFKSTCDKDVQQVFDRTDILRASQEALQDEMVDMSEKFKKSEIKLNDLDEYVETLAEDHKAIGTIQDLLQTFERKMAESDKELRKMNQRLNSSDQKLEETTSRLEAITQELSTTKSELKTTREQLQYQMDIVSGVDHFRQTGQPLDIPHVRIDRLTERHNNVVGAIHQIREALHGFHDRIYAAEYDGFEQRQKHQDLLPWLDTLRLRVEQLQRDSLTREEVQLGVALVTDLETRVRTLEDSSNEEGSPGDSNSVISQITGFLEYARNSDPSADTTTEVASPNLDTTGDDMVAPATPASEASLVYENDSETGAEEKPDTHLSSTEATMTSLAIGVLAAGAPVGAVLLGGACRLPGVGLMLAGGHLAYDELSSPHTFSAKRLLRGSAVFLVGFALSKLF